MNEPQGPTGLAVLTGLGFLVEIACAVSANRDRTVTASAARGGRRTP